MNNYDQALTPRKTLLPKHREVLYKSNLSDRTINEIGFVSSISGDSCLEPIKDIANKITKGYRARYDNIVIKENKYKSEDGSTPKYRPSSGLNNAFFYPHLSHLNWINIAINISIPIYITEGGKKAALLAQNGYACIGIFGVWNWKCKKIAKDKDDKEKELSVPIDDFNHITWKNRIVYIIFDSDKYKNLNVLLAEAHLWKHLIDLGASVKLINLPFDLEAKGIDDFYVKHEEHTNELFEDLVSKATSVPLGYINICLKEKRKEEIPHYLAEYLRINYRIINTNMGFYRYAKGFYKKIDNEEELKKIAKELLEYAGVIPKSHYLNETVKLLNSYCLIEDRDFNPKDKHNISNGLLSLDIETGESVLEKHSPQYYFNYISEVTYINATDTQLTEDYLKKIIPNENQRIVSLEALGFAMFPELRKVLEFTKVTLEYGEGSNGKTIYTGIRKKLLGSGVCSSTPIDAILKNQRFIASTLVEKRANFSTENESSFIKDSSLLKQITSGKPGDELLVEFKHKQPFSKIVNPILFFAINKPPILPANRTPALERRIQIVNFSNRFSKKPKEGELLADNKLENPEFTEDLINGLLILVLGAVKDMVKRGHIWQEGVSETLKEAISKGSHKERFFEENIEFDVESEIASIDLHKEYTRFCIEEGIADEHTTNKGTKIIWLDEGFDKACRKPATLSKWVKQRFKKSIQDVFVYNSENKRVRGFKGIKLKNKNVEGEPFNCATKEDEKLSTQSSLHSCTDEKKLFTKREPKTELLEKIKEKDIASKQEQS